MDTGSWGADAIEAMTVTQGTNPNSVPPTENSKAPATGPDLSASMGYFQVPHFRALLKRCVPTAHSCPEPTRPPLPPESTSPCSLPLLLAVGLRGWEPLGSECPSQRGASGPEQSACRGHRSPQTGPGRGSHSCWPTGGGRGPGRMWMECR